MNKFPTVLLVTILIFHVLFLFSPEIKASSDLKPFTPHEVRVLVISPADTYHSGADYLVSDLARYGFNTTYFAANDASSTSYLTDAKTSDLDGQYDVVILHGISGLSPSLVSAAEVDHFTNYRGILILIGNALFQNKSNGKWWGWKSDSAPIDCNSGPIQKIEQRLGVDFFGFLGTGGAFHNNGTFALMDNSIKGLNSSLSYVTKHPGSMNFQMDLDITTGETREIYDFTITSSPQSEVVGKFTSGITYYKSTNGVGIYVQGAYIYGDGSGTQISYFGLTDISTRASLLASLIAYAGGEDMDTLIKPQPLATIGLDGVGQHFFSQTYLNACLSNFAAVTGAFNIKPTVGFIDTLIDFPSLNSPNYWQRDAPDVLSQLTGIYRSWEYSTNLRYYTDPRLQTKEQIEVLIDEIKGNYSKLGMDLFSTVIGPTGGFLGSRWNQTTLDAMNRTNLYLIDIMDDDPYSSGWWNLGVNSSVLVHGGVPMLPERVWDGVGYTLAENFTQSNLDKDSIHYKYFSLRHRWALATINGFAGFVFYVPNFRWNGIGTYAIQTVFQNLTSEIPDIRFVPLMEAGLYFGNKWVRIENASRSGSIVEFDIDASEIPSVVSIGKGMLWLRINANESIRGVSIDSNSWSYFDNQSIRMPAPTGSSHVRIILGATPSPRIAGSRYKVVEAHYDGYRFNVSISSAPTLNVSVNLFLPQVGPFRNASWSVYSVEDAGNYYFDLQSRIFTFWAISDGFVTFEAGLFWTTEQTSPWYNSSVTIAVNITVLRIDAKKVTLSYHVSDRWINLTMTQTDGLWATAIPAMPYGTSVQYKVFVQDASGYWMASELFSYDVIDETPPEVGDPVWNPLNPLAGQSVSVNVSVRKPQNSSGVREVVLWYFLGTEITGVATATPINMTRENDDLWTAVIPGQSDGATVSFLIFAYDKAGNVEQTAFYDYEVGASPVSPFSSFQIMLIGISIVCGIGIVLYYVKSGKNKRKTTKFQ